MAVLGVRVHAPRMTSLSIGPSSARLRVHTGVEGKAARMGHDLVLALDDWAATVEVDGGVPQSAHLTAEVASLRVESGTGGAKPLSDKDRATIRKNALGAMRADRHPQVVFTSTAVEVVPAGYALSGTLSIGGTERPTVVQVQVTQGDGDLTLTARVPVRQTDHRVEPYSAMLGALRLRDEVEIAFDATVPQPG